jgi:hypothetical protein
VPSSDTSSAARKVQLEIQHSMSGTQRLLLSFEMSAFARELAKQRIRQEHPEWPETEIVRELIRLAFLPAEPPDSFQ